MDGSGKTSEVVLDVNGSKVGETSDEVDGSTVVEGSSGAGVCSEVKIVSLDSAVGGTSTEEVLDGTTTEEVDGM